jgi:hypothetical protein
VPMTIEHIGETTETYDTAGFRLDAATGKPILRVMKILRPAVYDSKDMQTAFEIGKEAHAQIERKFGPAVKKEWVIHSDRGEFIIECHLDLFVPAQALVMEIKSWKYFVEEHEACIQQLSAYRALSGATYAWFILYEGEYTQVPNPDPEQPGTTVRGEFRVKSKSQAWVPLIPADEILAILDAKGHALLADLRAAGKLA